METSVATMEQCLLADAAIKQAKIFTLHPSQTPGQGPETAVALSLADPDTSAIKRARKALVKAVGKAQVPRKWFVLDDLPVDAAGNVDEDALRHHLTPKEDGNAATTSVVDKLRAIVAGILRLPLAEVSASESFIKLGGDSITAIELMARCEEANITVRVPDIMRCESLSQLAGTAAVAGSDSKNNEDALSKQIRDIFAPSTEQIPEEWGCPPRWYDKSSERKVEKIELVTEAANILSKGAEAGFFIEPAQIVVAVIADAFRSTMGDRRNLSALLYHPTRPSPLPLDIALAGNDYIQTLRHVRDAFASGKPLAEGVAAANIPSVELSIRWGDEAQHPKLPTEPSSLFNVKVVAGVGKKVSLEIDYLETIQNQDSVRRWIAACRDAVLSGVAPLADASPIYSLSDFPLLPVSYPELDNFISATNALGYYDIEAAYPCTSVQNGILITQLRKEEVYRIDCVFEAKDQNKTAPIDLARVEKAWKRVVQHHSALRTIFASHRGGAVFDQVVLRTINPEIKRLATLEDGETALKALKNLDRLVLVSHRPAHRLTTASAKDGRVFCKLEISHALVDGMSGTLLLRDFAQAYADTLPGANGPLYMDYVSHLQTQDRQKALGFWMNYLDDVNPCMFPTLTDTRTEAHQMKSTPIDVSGIDVQKFCKTQGITFATLMQTVWATVLRAYTQTEDVCFGYLASGRDAPVTGMQSMVGVLIHLLICRVQFSESKNLKAVLQEVQAQLGPSLENQHTSLAEIQHGLNLRDRRLFNTIMSIVFPPPRASKPEENKPDVVFDQMTNTTATEYDLAIVATFESEGLRISLGYYHSLISEIQAQALANSFVKILKAIVEDPTVKAMDIDYFSDVDLKRTIADYNVPPRSNDCVHELIEKQIRTRPDDQAICGWDGELTYADLGKYASRLALRLQERGVGPETLVPICFPKSTWAVVTMVAVQMAGGAFVPLDPLAPAGRLQSILNDTKAKLVLAHPLTFESVETLDAETLLVDADYLERLEDPEDPVTSRVKPENAAFMIFTSGSTGKPKGMVMKHGATSTSVIGYGEVANINPGTRVFQFSAYTFDIGVLDGLTCLARGACVCVPSDAQRVNELGATINSTRANWIFLTPTVAALLSPEEVPAIKVLCLGGEAIPRKVLDRWKGRAQLCGIYGPAECSICAFNDALDTLGKPTNLGRPLSSGYWVVEPNNCKRLIPIGCIGELIVEGPMLSRGYLNVDSAAASNWLDDVEWLAPKRAYRTGDLVRRNENGTYDYVGRKDTQVKLNGQRIELGEIEARLLEYAPSNIGGIVEVVKDEATGLATLVAFMWFTEGPEFKDEPVHLVDEFTDEHLALIKSLDHSLGSVLAPYMMPSTYLILHGKPEQTVSGKVNRRVLNALGRAVPPAERARFSPDGHKHEAPTTDLEFKLRDLWAQVLKRDAEEIGKSDSFLRIGGDSISAIQLVRLARESDLALTVATIFKEPHLYQMAAAAQTGEKEVQYEAVPFSMIAGGGIEALKTLVRTQCHLIEDEEIEDAYPCTKLQEGLMALAVKQPGSYIAKNIYRIPAHVDLDRFRSAWEQTVELCEILRTRIVLKGNESIQALVDEEASWETTAGMTLQGYMAKSQDIEMQYGSRLCRYAIVQDEKKDNYFVWTIHHAAFDGWTMRVVMETLQNVYKESEDVSLIQPYSAFIKYVGDVDSDAAAKYWQEQLKDAKKADYPPPDRNGGTSDTKPADVTRLVKKSIPFPRSTNTSITKASVLRAAWAIVLARYCDSDDITFGTTVSGRQAPVTGIETMAGPMVATVPIRVKLDKQRPIAGFLSDIQQQASDMTAYEQFGLQNISKVCPDAQDACDFSSLMVLQPAQVVDSNHDQADQDSLLVSGGEAQVLAEESMKNYFSYPLVLQGYILEDSVDLVFVYDTTLLQELQLVALSQQFSNVVQQLLEQDQSTLGSVSVAGEWDLQQAINYNPDIPTILDTTWHQLVEEQAMIRPDAPAIHAWDHLLSYAELNAAANRLAHYLVDTYKTQPDELVHVCFEKSAWYFVSIIAVNKAGAAWVPLDPSHPLTRQQQVTGQTKARIALSSPSNMDLCKGLIANVVEISPEFDEQLKQTKPSDVAPVTEVTSDNAAYVLFTSGSTGTPKGLVMNHRAACTNQTACSRRLGINHEVRMLQFAAFVFDFSIGEMLGPLISGGCMCVPSEHERMNNIVGFMNEYKVNWAFLTPAFAQTLSPEDVPGLKLLLLGGEAIGRDLFKKWYGKVRFINGWGPAETCCFGSFHEWKSAAESPNTIGQQVGAACWLVDPDDSSRLAPIGTVGEIVIQGPNLLREYLADPIKTKAAISSDLPEWVPNRHMPGWNRWYKTGDLCYYNHDGSIEFFSRKDTQVKIRGQRVELGEVEHHIKELMPNMNQVAVDVYKTEAGVNLVTYLFATDETRTIGISRKDDDEVFSPMTDELQSQLTTMVGALSVTLPRYMIPAMFIPCSYMPYITSTKLDRKTLKRMTGELTFEQRNKYALQGGEKRAAATPMETRLQTLWAEILNIPRESIGRDDSFLRIGGDSIAAIHLVTAAREEGISLAVKDIFDDPRLQSVASKAKELDDVLKQELVVPPFSLLTKAARGVVLGSNDEIDPSSDMPRQLGTPSIREQCGLSDKEYIEDAFPATNLQGGLMAITAKQPGSYVAKYVYKVPKHVNLATFKSAWAETVTACTNLRTRILATSAGSLQVITRTEDDSAIWDPTDDDNLDSYMKKLKVMDMPYGSPLCRYALVKDGEKNYFMWIIHHAVYDGWSAALVMDTFQRIYHGKQPQALQPYSGFVKYTMGLDEATTGAWWREQLTGAKRASFPPPSNKAAGPPVHRIIRKRVDYPKVKSSFTKATILRAAWAIVLARYSSTDDICFGTAISGRQAPVPGLEAVPGLVVTTIPVRMKLSQTESIPDFLQRVQSQAQEMTNFEQYGLSNIVKLDEEIKDACDFSSLLVVQPPLMGSDIDSILETTSEEQSLTESTLESYFDYPFVIQGYLNDDHIELVLIYDHKRLREDQIQGLGQQFDHVLQQLVKGSEKKPKKAKDSSKKKDGSKRKEGASKRRKEAPAVTEVKA